MLVTGDMMGIKAQVVVTCTSKWERQLCLRGEGACEESKGSNEESAWVFVDRRGGKTLLCLRRLN